MQVMMEIVHVVILNAGQTKPRTRISALTQLTTKVF